MVTRGRLALAFVAVIAAWSAVLACKSNSDNDCGAPDHATYNCATQSADKPGCLADDVDASPNVTYPEGCQETLPVCLCCYPGPEICYCEQQPLVDGGTALTWGCPI